MKSKWDATEARKCKNELLNLRVYTSRLLGSEEDLVLHGGGNTSVKIREKNIFGEEEDILYVKGSGWDLRTIEAEGFAPVKLKSLLKLAELDTLSDMDMVKYQRVAMTNPAAPNPSVEAILHAIIPYTFVDHTHADAVVTVTNTPGGKGRIREIYGDKMMIVPYVMPGFVLAKNIFSMTRNVDWDSLDGMILMNHGVFTFHNDPKVSYENMIRIVSKAEGYLRKQGASRIKGERAESMDPLLIAQIRQKVSDIQGTPILTRLDNSPSTTAFSNIPGVRRIAGKGCLTPDHIIRTKRTPAVFTGNVDKHLSDYVRSYEQYFKKYGTANQSMLDPAPRWAVMPGKGTLLFGPTPKHLMITGDISRHTQKAIYQAEQLGGWRPLDQARLFEMEYWSLEQAKLKKGSSAKEMQGKIAIVTGAAGGIGRACVESLVANGAVVGALDIDPTITEHTTENVLGIRCDITRDAQLQKAIEQVVAHFGGVDMLVSNAGIFPASARIEQMNKDAWANSIDVNLNAHQKLLQLALPYLEIGFDPSVIIIGSKNVLAPGPGAAAYSVAKAGLTQLARVAALELGEKGIRVNVIHPNAVFDTGIWTDDILKARARHYGLTPKEYKTNNILKLEVTSRDVAQLAVSMLGYTYSKVTGAQVPIDGGNDRVI